ncbi:sarcosine oxidase [Pararhizobium capsulatum DSM 1112]|uniref:Sarcosine oxidase n=1 Tax=Pararhizobium capsulatum DSM 1112 TaxID=1121113 RepID=A0ABU0BRR9_9HYPH|nr:FAD-binding oxidoreductase [Pararhizobium capsulatum]MDQ0320951.1 sarcosine oxidase [Pararhizobium capsulatum DSM 1112]
MAEEFDFIVVGKGMMGAAAARHLALTGARIAVVGPDEPTDWAGHDGVFASHYDNGRITRTIDPDPVWARLAHRSIERYGEIAEQGGIDFYSEVGCLIAAQAPGGECRYLGDVIAARDHLQVEARYIEADALDGHFPYFHFPAAYGGIFEARGAGHINPRALVKAQVNAAEKAGVRVIAQEVVSISEEADGVRVETHDGSILKAGRVLISAGGFSISRKLFARPLDLVVLGRTVLFAEVSETELQRFVDMPSLITKGKTEDESFYLLPPLRYPDGRHYIKIGGDPTDIRMEDEAAARSWFRGEGHRPAADHMAKLLAGTMPDFKPVSTMWAPCVTTYTPHGYPFIGFTDSNRIAVLTGGNGAAAKSSDEIGRLGASLIVNGVLHAPEYETDFAVSFRE